MRIGVAFEGIRRRGARSWLVTWRVRDRGDGPMTVLQAWHPHSRFHSSRLRRSLRVPIGGSASLELPARVDAGPGDVVENCFLILRVARGRERWRVLARFVLVVDDHGMPVPHVEAVDAHPAEG
ncbi:MAG: hypothetical protein KGK34_11515 [Chloroflexota bacterium]|nr:hypothetical protein [Chloroflexota bacterium]